MAASCLFECSQKTKTAKAENVPAEADNYFLNYATNIDLAFKSVKFIESGDIIYIYYKFINWLVVENYFPIQNLPKIFFNKSSFDIWPVISPK